MPWSRGCDKIIDDFQYIQENFIFLKCITCHIKPLCNGSNIKSLETIQKSKYVYTLLTYCINIWRTDVFRSSWHIWRNVWPLCTQYGCNGGYLDIVQLNMNWSIYTTRAYLRLRRLLLNSEVKDELMTNFTMPRVPLLPSVKYKNRVQVVLRHFSQIHITQILTHHDD